MLDVGRGKSFLFTIANGNVESDVQRESMMDRIVATQKRSADSAKQKAADEKRRLHDLLNSNDFRKRLPGGPTQRGLVQVSVLTQLDVAFSVLAFKQECDAKLKQIIDKMMNG